VKSIAAGGAASVFLPLSRRCGFEIRLSKSCVCEGQTRSLYAAGEKAVIEAERSQREAAGS